MGQCDIASTGKWLSSKTLFSVLDVNHLPVLYACYHTDICKYLLHLYCMFHSISSSLKYSIFQTRTTGIPDYVHKQYMISYVVLYFNDTLKEPFQRAMFYGRFVVSLTWKRRYGTGRTSLMATPSWRHSDHLWLQTADAIATNELKSCIRIDESSWVQEPTWERPGIKWCPRHSGASADVTRM